MILFVLATLLLTVKAQTEIYAFVTTTQVAGDYTTAGMDLLCQQESNGVNGHVLTKGKNFKALVLANQVGRFRPIDIIPSTLPCYTLNGHRLNTDKDKWLDSYPLGAVTYINGTEFSSTNFPNFWTGAHSRQSISGADLNCNEWTSRQGNGILGSRQSGLGIDDIGASCSSNRSLLCVQWVPAQPTGWQTLSDRSDGIVVFPTAAVFSGDAGLALMDQTCQSEAMASILPVSS